MANIKKLKSMIKAIPQDMLEQKKKCPPIA